MEHKPIVYEKTLGWIPSTAKKKKAENITRGSQPKNTENMQAAVFVNL